MANKGLSMRKVREVLRLHYAAGNLAMTPSSGCSPANEAQGHAYSAAFDRSPARIAK